MNWGAIAAVGQLVDALFADLYADMDKHKCGMVSEFGFGSQTPAG